MSEATQKRVLVLGGGFAGVETAIALRGYGVDVTLVSDRDFLYLYPISIWIVTGEKRLEQTTLSLSALAMKHGFKLIVDGVKSFDASIKRAKLQSGRVLEGYDYIVIALGQGKMRHEGIEHTLSICGNPEEATALHERLEALIEKGEGALAFGFGGNPKDPSAVRGGPAFEVLFNVDHYLRKRGVRDKFRLHFFAPMPKPGQKMGEKALDMMASMFARCDIEQKTGSKIVAFDVDGIRFEDGEKIESDLTMFIPAGQGHPLLQESGLPLNEAGYVVTDAYCQVEGFEDIYAVGDSAALLGPAWRAKQGHVAEVMGRNTAYNIFQKMQGIDSKYAYTDELDILCVMDTGNGAAFVWRNDKRAWMIPMPIVGHWLKRAWGWYARNSKLGRIPRIPGM